MNYPDMRFMQNPQLQQLLMLVAAMGQNQEGAQTGEEQVPLDQIPNPYLGGGNINAPSPRGLSPFGRFNDMGFRRQAAYDPLAGRQAVLEGQRADQMLEDVSHSPPTSGYTIRDFGDGRKSLTSDKYGTGSISPGLPGIVPRGTFPLTSGTTGGFEDWKADQAAADFEKRQAQHAKIMDTMKRLKILGPNPATPKA